MYGLFTFRFICLYSMSELSFNCHYFNGTHRSTLAALTRSKKKRTTRSQCMNKFTLLLSFKDMLISCHEFHRFEMSLSEVSNELH